MSPLEIKKPTAGEYSVLGCGCAALLLVAGCAGLFLASRAAPTPENLDLIARARFGSWVGIALAGIIVVAGVIIRRLN